MRSGATVGSLALVVDGACGLQESWCVSDLQRGILLSFIRSARILTTRPFSPTQKPNISSAWFSRADSKREKPLPRQLLSAAGLSMKTTAYSVGRLTIDQQSKHSPGFCSRWPSMANLDEKTCFGSGNAQSFDNSKMTKKTHDWTGNPQWDSD